MRPALPHRAHALARSQRGLVTRGQLLDAGVASATLSRWVHRGWLTKVQAGVYALAGVRLDFEELALAALLYAGPEAVLSGPSAARVHGLRPFRRHERVELLVPRGSRVRPRGVDVRTSTHLPAQDRTEVRGLAVTAVARTIVDLGAVASVFRVNEALADAFVQGLLDPAAFHAAVDRLDHLPGIVVARTLRDGMFGNEGAFRSHTERRAAEVLAGAGHARPVPNHLLRCACGTETELDLYLEDERLDVEVDGPHHDRPGQRRRDRHRDRHLHDCAGVEVVRWPAAAVWSDPGGLLAAVAAGRRRALARRHS